MQQIRRSALGIFAGGVAATVASTTRAQAPNWPQRAVKFVLPLGPGAGVDIGARLFAERLSTRWGKPVVVENRPGGDGMVAINTVISANDDHTLLFTPTSSFIAHPYVHEKVPYEAKRVKLLAITNKQRATTAPEVATVHELGYAGLAFDGLIGLFGTRVVPE